VKPGEQFDPLIAKIIGNGIVLVQDGGVSGVSGDGTLEVGIQIQS
jgi:hypothetical protein